MNKASCLENKNSLSTFLCFQRSIEAKNEQLIAFKNRLEVCQVTSSTSDVFYPEDLNLAVGDNVSKSSDDSQYPFYNPLYGKEFESMYR